MHWKLEWFQTESGEWMQGWPVDTEFICNICGKPIDKDLIERGECNEDHYQFQFPFIGKGINVNHLHCKGVFQ